MLSKFWVTQITCLDGMLSKCWVIRIMCLAGMGLKTLVTQFMWCDQPEVENRSDVNHVFDVYVM